MNRTEEILSKVGLTKQETNTYLSLLRLQEAQTGELCKETGIASSNIYKILDSLIKKGLVSYRVQNNIKVFMPSPPEMLHELFMVKLQNLEQDREEIAGIVKTLKTKRPVSEPYSKYRYYEGLPGIKSMWYEINSYMDDSMLLRIHTSRKGSYETMIGFYEEHHALRLKNKIRERLIFPLEENQLAKRRNNQFSEVRFLELNKDCEWGTIGELFFMQYVTGKVPRGFLISDGKYSHNFAEVFDRLWDIAKR